jgi:hypothetical protein
MSELWPTQPGRSLRGEARVEWGTGSGDSESSGGNSKDGEVEEDTVETEEIGGLNRGEWGWSEETVPHLRENGAWGVVPGNHGGGRERDGAAKL